MASSPALISLDNKPAFWRAVLVLALPVAAQMLLQSFLGMADVIMVGELGSSAIAAVGLAAKIHFLMLVLMSGFATGCSVLIAQYYGARDIKNCERMLAVTLLVGTAIIFPITLAFGFGASFWVPLINPDAEVVRLCTQYLIITAPVLLLTQWIVIYEASLRALGNTTMPLIAGIIAGIVNIVGNYALIGGEWGFPALGVAGAAWATLAARLIQLLVIMVWVYGTRHHFALRFSQFISGFDRNHVRRYLVFSIPLVANYGIWAIGNSVYHVATGYAGTDALAVMGVLVPIESAFFALFVGLANAAAVLIGRELGAGQEATAWALQRFFDKLTIGLVIAFSIGLYLLRPWLLTVFDQLSESASALLLDVLLVFCLMVWIKIINMVRIIGVLRAGGDNRFTLAMDTVAMWVFGVPIYLAGVFFTPLSFLWLFILMYTEDILKFIPVMKRIASRKWMNNLTESA